MLSEEQKIMNIRLHKLDGMWHEVEDSLVFLVVAVALSSLLIWRCYAFTLRPFLYPEYAREMPYSLPILGQALSFFRDAEGTMTRARLYFGNKREPFALTIMGETIYVVTSSSDVSTVYRRTEDLTFDAYITDTMSNMGASPDATRRMWETPESISNTYFPNPKNEPLAHLSLTIFQNQLHPGNAMEELETVLLQNISQMTTWNELQQTCKAIITAGKTSTVSLLEWTTSVMLKGATKAFFGDALLKLDPNMLEDYAYFDKHSWKLIYKIPPPWSSGMRSARDRVRSTFTSYFNLPTQERNDACWMVKTLEAEMRGRGIGPQDIGAYLMSIYWVINGNAWKLAFWMLVHIFEDEAIFADVQAEARKYTTEVGHLSEIVKGLEKSPIILSTWHEALRFCTSAITIRDVGRETQVGNKRLRAGSRVIIPYRQMLRDSNIFGHDADVFRSARFIENKDLVKSPSFRPFGGGTTYCPGRFLAKKEVLLFVALVITRFDARKQFKNGAIPRLEEKRPCLGVLSAQDGDDLLLSVRSASS